MPFGRFSISGDRNLPQKYVDLKKWYTVYHFATISEIEEVLVMNQIVKLLVPLS